LDHKLPKEKKIEPRNLIGNRRVFFGEGKEKKREKKENEKKNKKK